MKLNMKLIASNLKQMLTVVDVVPLCEKKRICERQVAQIADATVHQELEESDYVAKFVSQFLEQMLEVEDVKALRNVVQVLPAETFHCAPRGKIMWMSRFFSSRNEVRQSPRWFFRDDHRSGFVDRKQESVQVLPPP